MDLLHIIGHVKGELKCASFMSIILLERHLFGLHRGGKAAAGISVEKVIQLLNEGIRECQIRAKDCCREEVFYL